jgi:YD repeat-containing protein
MRIPFLLLSLLVAGVAERASAQTYVYDAAGRLSRVLYASGHGVAYTYDNRDNLTQISSITVPPAVQNVSIYEQSPTEALIGWTFSGLAF